MGLFDVFKGSSNSKNSKGKAKLDSFVPYVIKTDNVSEALHKTAINYSISTAKLDFALLNYHTLIKMDKNDPDWTEIEQDDWGDFNQPKIMLNPNVEIKQVYEVEIIKHQFESWNKDLQLFIMTNREKNKISAIVMAGSKLVETDNLYE